LGGEELAVFFALVVRGHTLAYEPAALVRHPNYRDYADMRRIVHSYGVGAAAFLTRSLVHHPHLIADLALKLPYALFLLLSPGSPKHTRKRPDYPAELTSLELRGMLRGPWEYARVRWQMLREKAAGMAPAAAPTPAAGAISFAGAAHE
jgi:hypothetical protein